MSRIANISGVLAVALLMTPLATRAGPASVWPPPSNVRIVQKDGGDNVRTFTRLDLAVASITDASASNPYVVKVMPGSFDSFCPNVPAYVSIEGSGASQTTVCAFNVAHATVKDVTMIGWSGPWLYAGATLERVNLQVTGPIGVYVDASDVQVVDSTIQVQATGNGPFYGIFQNRGGFRLVRSKVISPGDALWLGGEGGAPSYALDIIDSEIEGGTSAIHLTAPINWITIRGSTLKATSVLVGPDGPYGPGYFVHAATSKLDGGLSGFVPNTTKIVHCYDGAMNPIPNL